MRLAIFALCAAAFAPVHAAVVYSNAPGGDSVTDGDVPVGASGWYYYSEGGGTVGINTSFPRSGNASAQLATTNPAAYSSIGYQPGGSLGALSALTNFGYDWYRSSASTTSDVQAPAMAVILDRDGDLGTADVAYLVYEPVYNGGGIAPTDAWQTVMGGDSTNLWSAGSLGFATDLNGNGYAYDETLAQWKAAEQSALVTGFVLFAGSGWTVFNGAVDNVSWTFAGGPTTMVNFEVAAAVPEPGALSLAGLAGLLAAAACRRRARRD